MQERLQRRHPQAQSRNLCQFADVNHLTVCSRTMHVLQAASTAARAELEAKNTLLHSELKTAQDACAEANGNLQRAQQEHASTVQSLQEKHTAAAAAMQVQLSDHQQQLLAAQTKAEEDSAAATAADQKIQELCGKIETYDLKQKGVGLPSLYEPWHDVLLKASATLSSSTGWQHVNAARQSRWDTYRTQMSISRMQHMASGLPESPYLYLLPCCRAGSLC
jgi:outer membrane receptor for ferric coprogen and ferric-rhodotorulic acid